MKKISSAVHGIHKSLAPYILMFILVVLSVLIAAGYTLTILNHPSTGSEKAQVNQFKASIEADIIKKLKQGDGSQKSHDHELSPNKNIL